MIKSQEPAKPVENKDVSFEVNFTLNSDEWEKRNVNDDQWDLKRGKFGFKFNPILHTLISRKFGKV